MKLHHHHHRPHVHGHRGADHTAKSSAATATTPAGTGQVASAFASGAAAATAGGSASAWSCFPAPAPAQSAAPSGQGLSKASEFGDKAIRTAGGYTIVPEGKDQAWSIYSPGQKPGDTPTSRIWGDPHVQEADGTKWDFSKSSNFKLPDGTNISVHTTAEQGHSLSSSLDITNGADRVQISGIDQNKPSVGAITHDGYEARANQKDADTFLLGGDTQNVKWFKQDARGNVSGEVTAGTYVNDDKGGHYEQQVDPNSQFVVDPSLMPKVGSEAWGNMVRDDVLDLTRQLTGSGSLASNLTAFGSHVQDVATHQTNELRQKVSQFSEGLSRFLSMFKLFNPSWSINRPLSF